MKLMIRKLGSRLFGTSDTVGTSGLTADSGKVPHLDATGRLNGSMTGVWFGTAAPVDGTTLANLIGPGHLLIDTTNKVAYINTGTSAAPVFKAITHA